MDGRVKVCLKVITATAIVLNQAYQYMISEQLSEMLSDESKWSTCVLGISLLGYVQLRKTAIENPVHLFG